MEVLACTNTCFPELLRQSMANTCFPATVETQTENFADCGPQIAQIPENRALRALRMVQTRSLLGSRSLTVANRPLVLKISRFRQEKNSSMPDDPTTVTVRLNSVSTPLFPSQHLLSHTTPILVSQHLGYFSQIRVSTLILSPWAETVPKIGFLSIL